MSDSAKELLEYRQRVENAMRGTTPVYFFNDNILKAMMIQRAILGGGEVNHMPGCVRMYCAQGSLFLLSGKVMATNAKIALDSSGLSDNEVQDWIKWDLWEELQEALKEFLSKGKQLELIVENINLIRQDSKLWQILCENRKNVSVYTLSVDLGLDHFTASMESYRIENSDEKKTATCAFHDTENARAFFDSFNVLKRYSQPVVIQ